MLNAERNPFVFLYFEVKCLVSPILFQESQKHCISQIRILITTTCENIYS